MADLQCLLGPPLNNQNNPNPENKYLYEDKDEDEGEAENMKAEDVQKQLDAERLERKAEAKLFILAILALIVIIVILVLGIRQDIRQDIRQLGSDIRQLAQSNGRPTKQAYWI